MKTIATTKILISTAAVVVDVKFRVCHGKKSFKLKKKPTYRAQLFKSHQREFNDQQNRKQEKRENEDIAIYLMFMHRFT